MEFFCVSTAEFLSSLGQYEIAIPVRVGPHGETLSEEETSHGNGRHRRSTESQSVPDPQLYYQLSTSSADLLLNLTLQGGLLSRQFRVEYWKRGHLAWSHPYLPNCHYVGHLQHQPHSSSVALSNCNGLVSSTVLLSEIVLSLKWCINLCVINLSTMTTNVEVRKMLCTYSLKGIFRVQCKLSRVDRVCCIMLINNCLDLPIFF